METKSKKSLKNSNKEHKEQLPSSEDLKKSSSRAPQKSTSETQQKITSETPQETADRVKIYDTK